MLFRIYNVRFWLFSICEFFNESILTKYITRNFCFNKFYKKSNLLKYFVNILFRNVWTLKIWKNLVWIFFSHSNFSSHIFIFRVWTSVTINWKNFENSSFFDISSLVVSRCSNIHSQWFSRDNHCQISVLNIWISIYFYILETIHFANFVSIFS